MAKKVKERGKQVVTREYTVNLHKKLHSLKAKAKAPRAIEEIRKFAKKMMGTKDVRLDVGLNKAVWSNGISEVPDKLRILVSRRRNEEEGAKEQFYSFVSASAKQPAHKKAPPQPAAKGKGAKRKVKGIAGTGNDDEGAAAAEGKKDEGTPTAV